VEPTEKGRFNEKRALQALKELKEEGDLVISFRQSSPEMDARGIDMAATIRLPRKKEPLSMSVPIEIKSSKGGVKKWKVVHSDLAQAGVLIFWLPFFASPRKIRRLFYRALTKVSIHSRGGTLYHGMFQRLFKSRGSKNLRKNVETIKRERAKG
jgi:hypothetical protein